MTSESINAADEAVLEAIRRVAEQLDGKQAATYAVKYAVAVKELAEAHAWLRSTDQPHGGGGQSFGAD